MADMTAAERKKLKAEYNWILGLASLVEDPNGSIQKFWNKLQKVINDSKGDTTVISAFVDNELPNIQAFADAGMYGRQIETTIVDAQAPGDPIIAAEIDRALDVQQQTVQALADKYGINITPERAADLAKQARYNGWGQPEILLNMRQDLDSTLMAGDAIGEAGTNQAALQQWAAANGLQLSADAAAAYVGRMTLGEQSFDDVKDEIRRTYLAGMYPAWADKINAGMDPSVVFDPYKNSIKNLLEMSDVGLDDPLMKQILQKTDKDGRPVAVPLYEAERMARQDPRWQQTDNAYATYANVATSLLRTFGFA